jgi:hypothetical protein
MTSPTKPLELIKPIEQQIEPPIEPPGRPPAEPTIETIRRAPSEPTIERIRRAPSEPTSPPETDSPFPKKLEFKSVGLDQDGRHTATRASKTPHP